MKGELKPDDILDVSDKACPFSLIETKKKVQKMKSGEILEVIASDPMAPENIAAWAEDHGHEVLGVEKEHKKIMIYVKKV